MVAACAAEAEVVAACAAEAEVAAACAEEAVVAAACAAEAEAEVVAACAAVGDAEGVGAAHGEAASGRESGASGHARDAIPLKRSALPGNSAPCGPVECQPPEPLARPTKYLRSPRRQLRGLLRCH
jgi:hypothetical protein